MYLSRIHLNPRCREARRDLSDPYQLHSTLCRAFSTPDRKCAEGECLWRLEPEIDPMGYARILVQSRTIPDWSCISVKGWLAKADPAIDLQERLKLDFLKVGKRFRFRLRANPCVTRNGKRLGLLRFDEQGTWIERKGLHNGFSLPKITSFNPSDLTQERIDVLISQAQMIRSRQRSGNSLQIFSVLYDGILTITDIDNFRRALQCGIGHGKVMGLGLLSVVSVA